MEKLSFTKQNTTFTKRQENLQKTKKTKKTNTSDTFEAAFLHHPVSASIIGFFGFFGFLKVFLCFSEKLCFA